MLVLLLNVLLLLLLATYCCSGGATRAAGAAARTERAVARSPRGGMRFPLLGAPPSSCRFSRSFFYFLPPTQARHGGGANSPSRPRCRWTSTELRGQASFVLYVGLAARPRSAERPRDGSPKCVCPASCPHTRMRSRTRVSPRTRASPPSFLRLQLRAPLASPSL